MKVLHLISSGGLYGAESVILSLCRNMNAGGDQCEVVVFGNLPRPNLELHEALVEMDVKSHVLECSGPLDRTVPRRLRALIETSDPDVLHAHGYKADVYAWLALRSSSLPLVSTCHTWYDNDMAARVYGIIDRLVLRQYTAVVAVSQAVEERLKDAGVLPRKIWLIRNGIDLNPFLSIPLRDGGIGTEHTLHIGLGGRLTREKGIDVFLRAAHGVLEVLPDVRFSVAGDGPDRVELQCLIDELHIEGNVRLLGRCLDMPLFYASLDMLVSSSRQEGLPIGLLEAMASGLPVIATAVGEVPKMILNGRTGTLVPPEDVEALTREMLRLLGDPHIRTCYGHTARRLVSKEFSASRMTAEYRALYARSIGEKLGAH
ncbi:Glycosyltransferase involved in cell wall bisynthesis [Granulicella pectinivorans]|uniref:Glycosyltransferase involved in cell wall bisynthesis n=1 Tax=Granulicella pectinivorans TaxID=474950 RepID=A0A1I6MM01_9BACT|nr:glycosyltransferase family 4 protein [Granulicella pectinivorans]SFS16756.1 Glycosyltransferase involved in cell wall bisynthesis [Granulicella pectinivorans]